MENTLIGAIANWSATNSTNLYTKFATAQLNISNVFYTDAECRAVCFEHVRISINNAMTNYIIFVAVFMIMLVGFSSIDKLRPYLIYVITGGNFINMILLAWIYFF